MIDLLMLFTAEGKELTTIKTPAFIKQIGKDRLSEVFGVLVCDGNYFLYDRSKDKWRQVRAYIIPQKEEDDFLKTIDHAKRKN